MILSSMVQYFLSDYSALASSTFQSQCLIYKVIYLKFCMQLSPELLVIPATLNFSREEHPMTVRNLIYVVVPLRFQRILCIFKWIYLLSFSRFYDEFIDL